MSNMSPSSAGGAGSIPSQGAKVLIPHGQKEQNIKQKQYCSKFNKDFKKIVHIKKSLKKSICIRANVKLFPNAPSRLQL